MGPGLRTATLTGKERYVSISCQVVLIWESPYNYSLNHRTIYVLFICLIYLTIFSRKRSKVLTYMKSLE